MTDSEARLVAEAQAILRTNDRGGYAVPAAALHPFQSTWDCGFVAMGWAAFDEDRAWQEIASLLRGRWDNGMIPHIVFHGATGDYFPGPEVWGVRRTPPTSGITQPPMLAVAVRQMLDGARDIVLAESRVAATLPALLANHRWWHAARDPSGAGLVATLHPWETGMDDSPAWDAPLDRVPATAGLYLVDRFRELAWDPVRMLAASPLKLADIGTNAILLRAEEDLLVLAERFGTPENRTEIGARIMRLRDGLAGLWSDAHGLFLSRDLVTGALIPQPTSAGFLPLFADAATPWQVAAMRQTMDSWRGVAHWLVPSTPPDSANYAPQRSWRGPISAAANWMIADGWEHVGEHGVAATLRDQTRELIARGGFREDFDPTDGAGLGAADLSRTAAIYLMLAH